MGNYHIKICDFATILNIQTQKNDCTMKFDNRHFKEREIPNSSVVL